MTEAIPYLLKYDSSPDTWAHIHTVQRYMNHVIGDLLWRAHSHDKSKLVNPEIAIFDHYTPKLKETVYGSPEYEACREAMGEALQHHYENNSHHPEYYPNGIEGMSLTDLVEMLCDWKAASERNKEGDILASLDFNIERFGIDAQLAQILRNTIQEWWA